MHWKVEQLIREGGRSGTTQPVPEPPAPPELAIRVLEDGREIVPRAELTIGRAPANDLVLDDATVSARHALLLPQGSRWLLYDCHSTNGVIVNGARVVCAELAMGALIVLGQIHLRVAASGVAARTHGIIAESPAMRSALARLERVAPTRLSVLLLGESGTGKELAARAVHMLSPRASGPFVAVNCSAIAHTVAESELFGHERGAFTGAIAPRPGVFEEASGGTLFLDEVGDLPPPLQPKLLRALETGSVRRVGARGEVRVDVRVVAATNRELGVSDFRLDLFHRLARVVVRLPPLRERPEDLEPLIAHFLSEIARDHRPTTLAPGALEALRTYEWPGNVRELRNAVERAALLGGPQLTAGELLEGADVPREGESMVAGRTLDEIERTAIAAALRKTAGNRRAAASLLGLARTTLTDRARRYGLL